MQKCLDSFISVDGKAPSCDVGVFVQGQIWNVRQKIQSYVSVDLDFLLRDRRL